MFYKALLLLLPTVAYSARLNVKVVAGLANKTNYNLNITHAGDIADVISETERKTFRLTDDVLYNYMPLRLVAWGGKEEPKPDSVFVRGPTPWGNLYLNAKEVHREISSSPAAGNPELPEIRTFPSNPINLEPVVLATEKVFNGKNTTVKYTVDKLKKTVEEIVSTTWQTECKLTVKDDDISYEFVGKQWDLPDFNFTGAWGKNDRISKTSTIGVPVTVELSPGELAVVALVAFKQTLEIPLHFTISLDGDVIFNYEHRYKGRHFHYHRVYSLLAEGGLPTYFRSIAKVNFVSYGDAHVIVSKNLTWTPPAQHKPISKSIKF